MAIKFKAAEAKRLREKNGNYEESDSESEDLEMAVKRIAPKGTAYVPGIFETMIESFGVNLQRKTLHDQFQKCFREAKGKFKVKEAMQAEIVNMISEAGENLKKLIQISCADSSGLKNAHNQLFLSLMDRLEYLKQQDKEKQERS